MNVVIVNQRELIDVLHEKSVSVYLVSGGFRLVIDPIAEILNIDRKMCLPTLSSLIPMVSSLFFI